MKRRTGRSQSGLSCLLETLTSSWHPGGIEECNKHFTTTGVYTREGEGEGGGRRGEEERGEGKEGREERRMGRGEKPEGKVYCNLE